MPCGPSPCPCEPCRGRACKFRSARDRVAIEDRNRPQLRTRVGDDRPALASPGPHACTGGAIGDQPAGLADTAGVHACCYTYRRTQPRVLTAKLSRDHPTLTALDMHTIEAIRP